MFSKIGIVGGLGWRSTNDYYAALHELAGSFIDSAVDPQTVLEMGVESLSLAKARSLLADGELRDRWEGFDGYHREALRRLEKAGAKVGLIACNTPHERLLEIRRGVALEVVDLFEAVADAAQERMVRRLVVLGTPTTMHSPRFRSLLGQRGIEAVIPEGTAAARLESLIADLQDGFVPSAPERLLEIVEGSVGAPDPQDLVGLHCTELPLALPQFGRHAFFEWQGFNFLNASIVHVEAALRAASLSTEGPAATA